MAALQLPDDFENIADIWCLPLAAGPLVRGVRYLLARQQNCDYPSTDL